MSQGERPHVDCASRARALTLLHKRSQPGLILAAAATSSLLPPVLLLRGDGILLVLVVICALTRVRH
jgi:hypothetical protein